MSSEHPLIAARRAKHERVLAAGGYPTRFERTHRAADIHREHGDLPPGTETDFRVTVAGRLMLHRSFGKLQFGTLDDWSATIQLFVDVATVGQELADRFEDLDLGDWVGATGTVMTTRKGELSVRVEELVLLQKALRPLPDKWKGLHDIEMRSRRRYVDLMVNRRSREVALARVQTVSELRRQFQERGFVEVETPILLAEATGANARPFLTYHNALGQDMQLRIATELYLKRLVVGGMERVFEIGRIFRNEGIDSTHNPEFTMLEAYQAFADYTDMMELVEGVLPAVCREVTGGTTIIFRGRELSLAGPYRRASMAELVSATVGREVSMDTPASELAGIATGLGIEVDPAWTTGKLISEIYEEAVEHTIWEPTFVTHHPVEVSPLARRNPDDPRVTDRFELVIAGSEYVNAFSELNDADDQRSRFEEQARARAAGDEEAHPIDLDYIMALEYGLPPTGGLGLGVDRLVMLLTGEEHIREVILFPTLKTIPHEEEEEE
ncbi:MAG: lysine--tRNA ligase [Actinomycetes bacterium]|jgi:lysyl-tRNA synthetase class 2|nr:MAG: lysine--tRNA ligase [Actinomycetota bacterium]